MDILAAEEKFGKRWDRWTEEEQIEFVKSLDETGPFGNPLVLNLACSHWYVLPEAFDEASKLNIRARMLSAYLEKLTPEERVELMKELEKRL